MPTPFLIETRGPLTRVAVTDPFDLADLQQLSLDIQPQVDPHGVLRLLFVDELRTPSLSEQGVRAAAELVELRLMPLGLVALATVAPHEPVYAVMRAFAALGETIGIRAAAFRDEETALAWLVR